MKESRGLRNNNEEWRDIRGYEGLYLVSSLGRIKSLPKYKCKTNRILKGDFDKDGYYKVTLCPNPKKRKRYFVHRLVAEAFITNPYDYKEVDHINCKRDDNRLENLRWVNRSLNQSNPITLKKLSDRLKGKIGKDALSSIPINQYDLDGNFLKEWGNAQDYGRSINKRDVDSIYQCLKKENRTAYGYKWKRA